MKKLKRFVITDGDVFVKKETSDDPHIIPLPGINFDRLQDFTVSSQFPIMHEITLPDGTIGLKPARYTGIITLKDGTQIEIMPQIAEDPELNEFISKKTLLYMLDLMNDIPIRNIDELYYKKEQLNIFEVCVRMFTDEVLGVVRSGLKQTYVPYQGNEMFVKGKTIYSEHAKKNFAHKEKFYVEYDVFSYNRAENRLIKTTLKMLDKLSANTLNKKRIKMLMLSLDGIDYSSNIQRDFTASVEDRSMNKYQNAMKWCRLFLLNKGTTTFFAGGKVSYAMLFPTDKLFCGCIASSLRRQINRGNYYFLTPEKITNSLTNTAIDEMMEPVSNFFVKNRLDGTEINIVFKFYDFSEYRGVDNENTVIVFPVTEILNRNLEGIGKNMYLIDLQDIDAGVSVLTETFFV